MNFVRMPKFTCLVAGALTCVSLSSLAKTSAITQQGATAQQSATAQKAATQSNTAERPLPEILTFYPNCDYEIVEKARVSAPIRQAGLDAEKLDLIHKLREKASALGADSLILEKVYTEKSSLREATARKKRVRIHALLIKTCESDIRKPVKPARFNANGQRTMASPEMNLSMSYSLKKKTKPLFARPELTNKTLSLEKGVYSVQLGTDYNSVVAAFGDPSVELKIYENQRVIGFGRRHWLYFIEDKLARVQTTEKILDFYVSNQVPMWPFFDDQQWQLAGGIKKQMTLTEIEKILGKELELNQADQWIQKSDKASLTMQFSFAKDHYTFDKILKLEYFDYKIKGYPEPVLKPRHDAAEDFAQVSDVYNQIQQASAEVEANLANQDTMGVIWLTPEKQLHLINNQLLTKVDGAKLVEVQFFQSLLDNQEQNSQWYIGEFKQGQTLEESRHHFPSEALEVDLEVLMDTDNYELKLFYEEQGASPFLYQAALTIY